VTKPALPNLERIQREMPDAVVQILQRLDEVTLVAVADRVFELLALLREEEAFDFDMLSDLTAVDHGAREPRFDVVYHLYSLAKNQRLRVRAGVPETRCEIDSVVALWPAANWLEREVFDLYGICFRKHPDLRRILLDDRFDGHPLRKDFPKRGRGPRPPGSPPAPTPDERSGSGGA
jgi:NADH-quinone oxidoreductase subunit C